MIISPEQDFKLLLYFFGIRKKIHSYNKKEVVWNHTLLKQGVSSSILDFLFQRMTT